MNRIALTLIGCAAVIAGCSNGTSDDLSGNRTNTPADPQQTSGNESTTYSHSNDPAGAISDGVPAEPAQINLLGSPDVVSRLHNCGKLTNTSVANLLATRGLTGAGAGRPAGSMSGQAIFTASQAQLGAANYPGRIPEAPFASTSAMSKLFDIFTMSSYDAADPAWTATACPGTKLIGTDTKFTKDGLSCLMGKPASDAHLAVANAALLAGGADGAKIAIASLMAAVQMCQ